jgi:hypothetical protein
MNKKPTALSYTTILLVLVISIAIPTLHSTGSTAATPIEFSLPITGAKMEEWNTLVGVGTMFHYPPDWQGRPYRAQGGVRDGATYEFVWTNEQGVTARIDVLEIVNPDTGAVAMASEVSYWQQQGPRRGYRLEQIMEQDHPAWWISGGATDGVADANVTDVVWIDEGKRVYRFRLHCRAEVRQASERVLRQMLSTLEPKAVDWSRAAEPRQGLSGGEARGEAYTPAALAGVPYDRSATYDYAETYWDVLNNDDACYLWYNGSTLDCTYHDGDWGVDGAHFMNRAVHAGGRPIPGLWGGAALRVADLRDWLQSDGWTGVDASQAQVGDVAIMGPFDNPCWVGLVVGTGGDPALATHSDEYWLPASQLYCNSGGQPSYEKTYLHAEIEFTVHLPLVLRNWPPPTPKVYTGIHLGNHVGGDWTDDELALVDGDAGGAWPRVIVVQSKQVWNVWRPTESPCEVAGADVWNDPQGVDRRNVHDYLTRAAQNGVTIIIRVAPSPGNFEEAIQPGWPDPDQVPGRTLITQPGVTPGGTDYCGANWEKFRAVDDIVREMDAIHTRNQINGWPTDCCYFEPANEPNLEWYKEAGKTIPSRDQALAWQAMDDYFAALIAYARASYPALRILTPPMSQGQYAEGIEWGRYEDDYCPEQLIEGQKGYELMPQTYEWRADGYHGYSWHNYYIQGWESYRMCDYGGFHVSRHFPDFMSREIVLNDRPAFVTETDLCSPAQCHGRNPLRDKDSDLEATGMSLRYFFATESNLGNADGVALWLLRNDEVEREEYDWHEAYSDATHTYYNWFDQWWRETP